MMTVDDLFKNYESEAFRLEALPQYKVEGEREEFLLYKEKWVTWTIDENEEYFVDAKQKISEGKRHIRTRVIPNPLTEYFVFETKAWYMHYEKLWFEMYFVEQDEYLKAFNEWIADFRLFDKKHIVMMQYWEEWVFISATIVEDSLLLEKLLKIREFMIKNGRPLAYVLEKYQINA